MILTFTFFWEIIQIGKSSGWQALRLARLLLGTYYDCHVMFGQTFDLLTEGSLLLCQRVLSSQSLSI